MEVFKDIVGVEGYRISNYGRVWNLRLNKELKGFIATKNYRQVTLSKGQYTVHKLVAQAFFKEYHGGYIRHKDGNTLNNTVYNLVEI